MTTSNEKIDGFAEVVLSADWRCNAVDGDTTVTAYGSVGFPRPEKGSKFVTFEKLTEELVLSWAWESGVDKDEIESSLNGQLKKLSAPKEKSVSPPWVTEEAA